MGIRSTDINIITQLYQNKKQLSAASVTAQHKRQTLQCSACMPSWNPWSRPLAADPSGVTGTSRRRNNSALTDSEKDMWRGGAVCAVDAWKMSECERHLAPK